MESSVRICRMEVWKPGAYFQTNANSFSNKHLFLSHAILLPHDSYTCIWNKNSILLCICSLGLSRAQGYSAGLQYTVTLNIYLCTSQHWSAFTFVWQRQGDLSLHMCVCTPASQQYFLWVYNNAVTATVAADHDRLQSKCFWCFPKPDKRTKNTCDVFNVCFDLHVNRIIMTYASTPWKLFYKEKNWGFFNGLCSVKLTTSRSWSVLWGNLFFGTTKHI